MSVMRRVMCWIVLIVTATIPLTHLFLSGVFVHDHPPIGASLQEKPDMGSHCYQCEGRKNVLFLMADDLRPELGAYLGQDYPTPVHPRMWTPHLDELAAHSLLLKRAYVQQATCNPSRTSLLTGRRPDTTRVHGLNKNFFRDSGGNFTTLPQYFKNNGYKSIRMGKLFHQGFDDPLSWSADFKYFGGKRTFHQHKDSWRAIPDHLLIDTPLQDEQIATQAIDTLRVLSDRVKQDPNTNFFLAVGFHRPHLQWVFPESMFEYYPQADIELPPNPTPPENMPTIALFNYTHKFGRFNDIPDNGKYSDSLVRTLRRAYYSSVTFMDVQVGRVLAELQHLGLANNTIVSFCGDHGWQLGEHSAWMKETNFDLATHAPLMIRVPGLTDSGIQTRQLVEFVDLYPTLVEAAGLPSLPQCPEDSRQTQLCREGMSMMPLIKHPNVPLKTAAFSQFNRYRDSTDIMGYSMRTDQYRYTEWPQFTDFKPNWDNLFGVELYDHFVDPDENVNQAYNSSYLATVTRLSKALHEGWRQA